MKSSILLALLFAATLAPAQTKRPMTFEDMMQMKRLGEPPFRPTANGSAYSVTTVDLDKNTKTAGTMLQSIAQSRRRSEDRIKLAVGQPGDGGIRVLAGRQAHSLHVSSRDGGQQVWLADFDAATGATSNPKKLTSIATEADNAKWSPDWQVDRLHVRRLSRLRPPSRPADADDPATSATLIATSSRPTAK